MCAGLGYSGLPQSCVHSFLVTKSLLLGCRAGEKHNLMPKVCDSQCWPVCPLCCSLGAPVLCIWTNFPPSGSERPGDSQTVSEQPNWTRPHLLLDCGSTGNIKKAGAPESGAWDLGKAGMSCFLLWLLHSFPALASAGLTPFTVAASAQPSVSLRPSQEAQGKIYTLSADVAVRPAVL